jgi:LuxR family maltose regulon positive regulatory protein
MVTNIILRIIQTSIKIARVSLMNQIVLQQKFTIPNSGTLFNRPELVEKLNIYSLSPLTLIIAPAGYGKTSLVCDWLQYARHPIFWLSLDAQNNLPSSFWLYLFNCLKRIDRDLDDSALQMLNTHFIEDYCLISDLILASLEKLTRKWNRPNRVVIVLDDFHYIDHPQILQSLNRFLDYIPNWLQLIITSRERPKLMLPNRCSKAKAHIIDASDLIFKSEQIANYLSTKLGLALLEEDLQIIYNQTEGWATAIQLAGLAIKAGASLEDCTSTNDTLLSDFLFDEVFSQLDSSSQQLLCDICITDHFSLELCQRFSPERNNESILEALINQGLFISKISDIHPNFRLHSLFRQWLQDHTSKDPLQLHHNQRIALTWLESKRDYHQALELSITLKDWLSCSEIMRQLYPSLVHIHCFDHVSNILNRIPEDILITLPHFCLLKALLHFSHYQYEHVEKYNEYIEAYFAHSPVNSKITDLERISLLMGSRILQAQMARFSGQPGKASAIQQDIENTFQDSSHSLTCWLIFGKAVDLFIADQIQQAIPHFQSALALAKEAEDGLCVISTLGWLLHALYHNGQVQQGIKLAETNILWLNKLNLLNLPNASSIHAALAILYLEDNQLQKAWHSYSYLLANINDFTDPREIIYNKFHTHFHLLTSTGRYQEARACLQQLEGFEHQFGQDINADFSIVLDTNTLSALLELRHGNSFPLLQIAQTQVANQEGRISSQPSGYCQFRHLYERMIIATGNLIMTSEICEEFSKVALESLNNGNISRAITCHLIPAKVLYTQNHVNQALQHFKLALAISAKHQFINLIIEDTVTIFPLLELALKQDIESAFCQNLLSTISVRQQFNDIEFEKERSVTQVTEIEKTIVQEDNFHQYNQGMVDSLSPRELEVLGLINQGKRNKEIAAQLAISLSTGKRHLQNIYQKLQVSSRTEAIAILNHHQKT